MSEPLISIVLPIYNGEKYMRESIDSVLAQTWRNWELIIMDDCSTDRTQSIAETYAHSDNRIQYHRNEKNLRLPANLNRGFSFAKGDYLTWTSDDNMYLPAALEKMITTLIDSKAGFVFADMHVINYDGQEITSWIDPHGFRVSICGKNIIGACFMYTRATMVTVGEYDTSLALAEDIDYWQRAFQKVPFVSIDEKLYIYRFTSESLTGTVRQAELGSAYVRMLQKNKPGFGKMSVRQKHYFYTYLCENENKAQITNNKDERQMKRYRFLYRLDFAIRKTAKRFLNRIGGSP